MNYLGHAFLTPKTTELLIGNFLGDHIKGKMKSKYPEFVQDGVRLHRFIDTYTDSHEIVRSHCRIMEPKLGHLSGVAMDMLYDTVLSRNWNKYSDQDLQEFIQMTYDEIDVYSEYWPPKFKMMYTYMKKDNWLGVYGTEKGMMKALTGLQQRIKFENNLPECWGIFLEHEQQITDEYDVFIKDIQNQIRQQFL